MRRSWRTRGWQAHPRKGQRVSEEVETKEGCRCRVCGTSGVAPPLCPGSVTASCIVGASLVAPSPAAGRPSLQTSPSWQMGPGPSEATTAPRGPESRRIMGEPGGTVSGRSTRQKAERQGTGEGRRPRSLAGTGRLFRGPGRISSLTACPQTAAG